MILPDKLQRRRYRIDRGMLTVEQLRIEHIREGGFLEVMDELSPVGLTEADAVVLYAHACNHQPHVLVFVAELPAVKGRLRNTVVGSMTLVLERKYLHGGQYAARIEDAIVAKGHRRRGIARKLGNHLLAVARWAGAYKGVLDSRPDAEGFWRSLGFEPSEQGYRLNL